MSFHHENPRLLNQNSPITPTPEYDYFTLDHKVFAKMFLHESSNLQVEVRSFLNPRFSAFERPISLIDNLSDNDYIHVNPNDKTCAECEKSRIIRRESRHGPLVHFGIVASGNRVIKDGVKRGKILESHPGVIAVEMEAAG
jgi:nucleoside phosphorylase